VSACAPIVFLGHRAFVRASEAAPLPTQSGLLSARGRPRFWALLGALGGVHVQNTAKSAQHHGRDRSSVSSTVPSGAATTRLSAGE
jgi:hypothetical protein